MIISEDSRWYAFVSLLLLFGNAFVSLMISSQIIFTELSRDGICFPFIALDLVLVEDPCKGKRCNSTKRDSIISNFKTASLVALMLISVPSGCSCSSCVLLSLNNSRVDITV